MSYSRHRSRYSDSASPSPSPYKRRGRSVSRSMSRSTTHRSRSRSRESSAENPGNNLYVTGLSARVTKRDLEEHFSTEGKVVDVHLVTDPWSRESRGFGFVTMSSFDEAERCIKYLNRSVLEGRVITVEKARRSRGRTPTPGRYLGMRTVKIRNHSPGSRSSSLSSERRRSVSPYSHRGRRSSRSSYYSRRDSLSSSRSPYSRSPLRRYRRYDSPEEVGYYRRSCYRSVSRSYSPRGRSYSRSYSPLPRRYTRRSYSRSYSPRPRWGSGRSYCRSFSPRPRRRSMRSYSRSYSPRSERSYSRSQSPAPGRKQKGCSRKSYSSRSYSSGSPPSRSRSVSKTGSPRSVSPSR